MKIKMFKSEKSQKNFVESQLHVPYGAGKRRIWKRWYLLLALMALPFVVSLGIAFYNLVVVGAEGKISTQEIEVRATTEGWIDSLKIKADSYVHLGDTLLHIRNPKWEEEELNFAKGHLDMGSQGSRAQQLGATQTMKMLWKQKCAHQKEWLDKLSVMVQQGSATRVEYNQAWIQLKDAQIELERLRVEENRLKTEMNLAKNSEDVNLIEESNLEKKFKLRKEREWILSTDSGVILKHKLHKGQFVTEGQLLLKISHISQMTFTAWLSPSHLSYAQPGRTVTLEFPNRLSIKAVILTEPIVSSASSASSDGNNPSSSHNEKLAVEVLPLEPIAKQYWISGLPFKMKLTLWNQDLSPSEQVMFEKARAR